MAAIIILKNPLSIHDRETFDVRGGTKAIDWLQDNYPDGFGMPITFYVNEVEKKLDDLDYEIKENDVVVFAMMPAGFALFASVLIRLVIGIGLSLLAKLFAPKKKPQDDKQKDTIYSVSSAQNSAKLADPIPVIYGDVITVPDYVAQPYTWINQSSSSPDKETAIGIQYLDMIMCVGQGEIDVHEVFAADTDSNTLNKDLEILKWRALKPSQHNGKMGAISSAMGGNFYENVSTSAEVNDQVFEDLDQSAGWYVSSKPGVYGASAQIDIHFHNGLYRIGQDDTYGLQCDIAIEYIEVDANNNFIGTSVSNTYRINHPSFESGHDIKTGPMRKTINVDLPKSSRWAFKLTKKTAAAKSGSNRFSWTGLKLIANYKAGDVYGDQTLLAVRVRASRGLGEQASTRIKAKVTRRLPVLGTGLPQPTNNPVDAFIDIYTNQLYGARRPLSEIDMTKMAALRTRWANYPFNAIFQSKISIWSALEYATAPYSADPLPIGPIMSIAEDGVKPIRSAIFSDQNIISDSLNVSYQFDVEETTDGIEVEWHEPYNFDSRFVTFPLTSLKPERISLFGCTDRTHAFQYAKLQWRRRIHQRTSISFDTELDGMNINLGDRIGVSTSSVQWAESGYVIGQAGNTFTVDHDVDWSGSGHKVIFRKDDGTPTDEIDATKGSAANQIVISGATFTANDGFSQEPTHFVIGPSTSLMRDFLVTAIKPGEAKVNIQGIKYTPALYDGAMPFLGGAYEPVPDDDGGVWYDPGGPTPTIPGGPEPLHQEIVSAVGDDAVPGSTGLYAWKAVAFQIKFARKYEVSAWSAGCGGGVMASGNEWVAPAPRPPVFGCDSSESLVYTGYAGNEYLPYPRSIISFTNIINPQAGTSTQGANAPNQSLGGGAGGLLGQPGGDYGAGGGPTNAGATGGKSGYYMYREYPVGTFLFDQKVVSFINRPTLAFTGTSSGTKPGRGASRLFMQVPDAMPVIHNVRFLTAGAGTWTVPTNFKNIWVRMWQGGAGSHSGSAFQTSRRGQATTFGSLSTRGPSAAEVGPFDIVINGYEDSYPNANAGGMISPVFGWQEPATHGQAATSTTGPVQGVAPGGGGSPKTSSTGSHARGSGQYCMRSFTQATLTPGTVVNFTIGAGGAGESAEYGNGGPGGIIIDWEE